MTTHVSRFIIGRTLQYTPILLYYYYSFVSNATSPTDILTVMSSPFATIINGYIRARLLARLALRVAAEAVRAAKHVLPVAAAALLPGYPASARLSLSRSRLSPPVCRPSSRPEYGQGGT